VHYTDNVNVKLPLSTYGSRVDSIRLRQLTNWLKKNNIKYSYVYWPVWDTSYPSAINMRTEDALIFKLVFNL
jgi:hypothetical protein